MHKVIDLFTSRYQDCPYTVIQVGPLFIITMYIKGNLHRGHIVILKSFLRRLFRLPYSGKQMSGIQGYTKAIAESTIDTVLMGKVK